MSKSRVLEAFAAALLQDDPEALYDRAPCGYVSAAPDGTLLKTNRTFRMMTGHDAVSLVGRPLVDLLSTGARVFYETHIYPMLELRGSVSELAVDIVCADGTHLPVLLNATLDRAEQAGPATLRLAVFDATERRRYERELLRIAEAARQAQRATEEAERETRRLVDTLQGSLIPRALPTVEGLDLGGAHRAAGDGLEVGGDFFDVFEIDGDWWVLLGDVSGKGVEAAVVTGLVRHGARALVMALGVDEREPAELLHRLDRLLDHHESERFCTVVVLRLRRGDDGWVAAYASAGHPPPLLSRPGHGIGALISTGSPLGLHLGLRSEQHQVTLEPGDTLLLYTDGVTEARVESEELYGDGRLLAEFARLAEAGSAPVIAEGLVEAVVGMQAERPLDDVAVVALRVT